MLSSHAGAFQIVINMFIFPKCSSNSLIHNICWDYFLYSPFSCYLKPEFSWWHHWHHWWFWILSVFPKLLWHLFLFKHKHDNAHLWELRTFIIPLTLLKKKDTWIYYHEKGRCSMASEPNNEFYPVTTVKIWCLISRMHLYSNILQLPVTEIQLIRHAERRTLATSICIAPVTGCSNSGGESIWKLQVGWLI